MAKANQTTTDNRILELKAEVFDLLRSQESLNVQIRDLEQTKQQKLAELSELEA